jgi:uncharacterized protein
MSRLFWFAILAGTLCCCKNEKKVEGQKFEARIIDHAGILTPPARDSLSSLISKLQKDVGSELAVCTIDSLPGQDIETVSFEMAEKLGLGRNHVDDGVLILIALKEKTARVEVGIGLENIIRDEIASRILREDLGPRFQQGKYGEGLYVLVQKLSALIRKQQDRIGEQPEYLQRWDSIEKAKEKE